MAMKKAVTVTKQREAVDYFSAIGGFDFLGVKRFEDGSALIYTRNRTVISAASARALGEFLRGGPPEKPVTRKPGFGRRRV